MRRLALVIALAVVGVPAGLTAQQISVSKSQMAVEQTVTIQLEREPEHNESFTWTIQSGDGTFVGDTTRQTVTFKATKPGPVVIACVIKAPGQLDRRPTVSLTVVGSAAEPTAAATAATTLPATRPAQPRPPAAVPPPPPAAGNAPATLPLEQIDQIVPAGWMGDAMADNGETATLDIGFTDGCRSTPSCYRVEYRPGKVGWAAFAWQHVPAGSMNWGEYPGVDLSGRGFRSLRVWARGDFAASGGAPPKVQFKSGGNVAPNFTKTNAASYSVAGPTLPLTAAWTEYCLDVPSDRLNNVVSPFTIVVTKAANPKGAALVFDDVAFSTSACPR